MSNFTTYRSFIRIKGRKYRIGRLNAAPIAWEIGRKGSGWNLFLWPSDTADVTIPWYAEWLVHPKLVDPHDPDLLAAAFVHDKLLNQGHDKAFASAEFRRALAARGWKTPLWRWLAMVASYLHTTGFTRH